MLATNMSGTILIRDDTPLPAGLAIESEAFLPGWKAVKNLDRHELGRRIEGAKWNFFYLAGEIRVTVLGRYGRETLRRAVKCVLLKREDQRFNSLQITKVVAKSFLGIPFLKLTAHSRHIQESVFLLPAKEVALATRPLAAPEIGGARSMEARQTVTSQHTALISSS
jgi:hypothetical protein